MSASPFLISLSLSLPRSIDDSKKTAATHLVQGPARVAGDGELQVEGQVHDILGGGPDVGSGLDLGQAVADEPDAVDEQAIGVALQLEVAEEGVCAEEGEDLVEDVVALGLGVGRLVGGQGRVGEGQRVGGPAGLCAQGKQGEVPDQARLVGVGVEDGVVGLRGAERGRELAGGVLWSASG